jgi:hypothetical protein
MADSCYVRIGHGPRLLSVGGLWQVVLVGRFQLPASARIIAPSRESVFFNRSARIGAIALGTVQKRRRHSLEAASGAPLLGPLLP